VVYANKKFLNSEAIYVNGDFHTTGAIHVNGDIHTTGAIYVNGNIHTTGAIYVNGNFHTTDAIYVNGDFPNYANLSYFGFAHTEQFHMSSEPLKSDGYGVNTAEELLSRNDDEVYEGLVLKEMSRQVGRVNLRRTVLDNEDGYAGIGCGQRNHDDVFGCFVSRGMSHKIGSFNLRRTVLKKRMFMLPRNLFPMRSFGRTGNFSVLQVCLMSYYS